MVAASTVCSPAHAAETVTYEIVSQSIPAVDVEYMTQDGRTLLVGARLPWRMDVALDDPRGPTGEGAQIRADWRGIRGPARWVTVRIYSNGEPLCQSTLDVGNVSCYGNTPHFG